MKIQFKKNRLEFNGIRVIIQINAFPGARASPKQCQASATLERSARAPPRAPWKNAARAHGVLAREKIERVANDDGEKKNGEFNNTRAGPASCVSDLYNTVYRAATTAARGLEIRELESQRGSRLCARIGTHRAGSILRPEQRELYYGVVEFNPLMYTVYTLRRRGYPGYLSLVLWNTLRISYTLVSEKSLSGESSARWWLGFKA